jgi:hypothetical protein
MGMVRTVDYVGYGELRWTMLAIVRTVATVRTVTTVGRVFELCLSPVRTGQPFWQDKTGIDRYDLP